MAGLAQVTVFGRPVLFGGHLHLRRSETPLQTNSGYATGVFSVFCVFALSLYQYHSAKDTGRKLSVVRVGASNGVTPLIKKIMVGGFRATRKPPWIRHCTQPKD